MPSNLSPRFLGARIALLLLAASAALLAACGSGQYDPYALCGNGRIDQGEQCDDGNLSDSDGCLSTCVIAKCGDGFVDLATEQCDRNNFGTCKGDPCSCPDFGFDGGPVTCSNSCQVDLSSCGAAFTPTPTPTATPAVTATATATPTPTPICGDHLLESGETCEACAVDCQVPTPPCQVDGVQPTSVVIGFPSAASVSKASVFIGYRTTVLSLPGSGSEPRTRVKDTPSNSLVTVSDLDYALQVSVQRSRPLAAGQLFTVSFDVCQGTTPAASDFSCAVTDCGGASDCECEVDLQ